MGTPCRGPRQAPRAISVSAFLASASADSAVTVMYAFRTGLSFSIRARHAFVASTGETDFFWMRALSSVNSKWHSSRLELLIDAMRMSISLEGKPGSTAQKHVCRYAISVGVRLNAEFHGVRVAAAGRKHERNVVVASGLHHRAIALLETFVSKREPAQSVGSQGIHSCLIKDDVGREREHVGKCAIKLLKVFKIACFVGKISIETAPLLPEREITVSMNAKRKDIRIVLEDFSRAVTLMDVEIHHSRTADATFFAEPLDCHRNVIKNTETCALGPKSMVRSSAQSSAPAMLQCVVACTQRSANGREGAANQIF